MEPLSFGDCVKKSWGSTWQAIVQMPAIVLGACVVFACVTMLSDSFQHTPAEAAHLSASTLISHSLIRMALSILNFVVSSSLIIKIHRFVLLGEGSQPLVPLGGKPLGRYLLVSLCLALLAGLLAVALVLLLHQVNSTHVFLVLVPLSLVYIFVAVRLGLLYPALALGAGLKLRAAWNDSRGHFWSMWWVGVVVALPVIAVWLIWFFAVTLARPVMLTAEGQASPAFAIGLAVVNTLIIVLVSAAASWLYRRYAKQLRDEVGPGVGPTAAL
ncbi:hypothetical protein [Paraburkholderia sp. DHOC27]|uniref:hypothetical protein n=1 Tax=Paraburkholderia sp. DHOC27 TaxID=2303330 RepID=UPI000E3D9172|nr:hypothetical protein [Paraburkholderia sp. DHOC27]RFU44141.1 hypothetical protein D0B32_29985 [Paraburkholderia sp. DHOC27]